VFHLFIQEEFFCAIRFLSKKTYKYLLTFTVITMKPFSHRLLLLSAPFLSSFVVVVVEGQCFNDKPGSQIDKGCTAIMPMCFLLDGTEPTTSTMKGYVCGMCINDALGDGVDKGCSNPIPRCLGVAGGEIAANRGGAVCGPAVDICSNSATGATLDSGCNAAKPICVNARSRNEVGSGQVGQLCAKCLNSNNSANPGTDVGCTAAAPNCVMSDGKAFALNKSGARCCPNGGCPNGCPCFASGSIFAQIKANPTAYTYVACFQSYDQDSIEVQIKSGTKTYSLVGAGGGWWGAGTCYGDVLPAGRANQLAPDSKGLVKASRTDGNMCASDLRTMTKDVFKIDTVQACAYGST